MNTPPDRAHTLHVDAADLTLTRGSRVVVKDLTLAVGPGAAVVVRGPNGVGKSTLLRALCGFVAPTSGAVRWRRGEETCEPGEAIAYVGHADGLAATETPNAHLALFTRWFGADRTGVTEAKRIYGVTRYAHRQARTLSAGQRRRAALARVLASGRAAWILDEPAAPLDAAGRAVLADQVARHRARGGLVIAVAHDALEWADVTTVTLEPV